MNPKSAAFLGFLFTLPFIVANFIVSLRIEPFYSLLGKFPAVRNSTLFPLLQLLLFPIGAFIAIRPVLKKSNGKWGFYPVNIVLVALMLIVFFLLFIALAGDTYRCDVLKIPNCD